MSQKKYFTVNWGPLDLKEKRDAERIAAMKAREIVSAARDSKLIVQRFTITFNTGGNVDALGEERLRYFLDMLRLCMEHHAENGEVFTLEPPSAIQPGFLYGLEVNCKSCGFR